MTPERLTLLSGLIKEARPGGLVPAVLGSAKDLWGAVAGGANVASRVIKRSPHLPDALGTAVKYSPHAAAAYGGKKVYDSQPVQDAKWKFQVWNARRKQQKAMGY